MYLVLTNKFSDTNWKLLGWIVYISLVAISVWFTWGALDKFAKQETAIRQYEDKIEAHPTITLCNLNPYWEYQKIFNIIKNFICRNYHPFVQVHKLFIISQCTIMAVPCEFKLIQKITSSNIVCIDFIEIYQTWLYAGP